MLERRRGAIVNLVSAAGMSDPPVPPERGGWGFAYGASKAALIRMAGCLAVEHAGAGVSFFNLEPGLILTESMRVQGLTEDLLASVGGGAAPEVPAAVIAWLATDPGAAEWHGKTVHAQPLAKQLGPDCGVGLLVRGAEREARVRRHADRQLVREQAGRILHLEQVQAVGRRPRGQIDRDDAVVAEARP